MMSSSSSAQRVDLDQFAAQSDFKAILRLLNVMALDWADISATIAQVGVTLSSALDSSDSVEVVGEMQAFDRLSQRTMAQFLVLDRVRHELSAGTALSLDSVARVVATVPFADLRASLTAALRGEAHLESEQRTDASASAGLCEFFEPESTGCPD